MSLFGSALAGAATGFLVGGPAGAAIGFGVGAYQGYEAEKAEREADRARREAELRENRRRDVARLQMLAERRRMNAGAPRFTTTPEGSQTNVGTGSVVSGLQLGTSTGLIVPVAM